VTLWVVTPCNLVVGYKLFGDIYSLYLQGRSDFEPEDGGGVFLGNVGIQLQNYMVSQSVDPLLGNDREISKIQLLSNGFANKHICTATTENINRGTVLSV
jgi:hypothetical protein